VRVELVVRNDLRDDSVRIGLFGRERLAEIQRAAGVRAPVSARQRLGG